MEVFKKNVRIFTEGVFNRIKTTKEHLKSMVEAFNDLGYMPDIKITHEDTKSERDKKNPGLKEYPFSVGKVSGLELDGNWLTGDYVEVNDKVQTVINNKGLTTHSAEIYYNVTSKKTGKKYSAVLAAVALLLPGEMPALFEELENYNYSLAENNQDDFEFESKKIYLFNEESIMTKEEYMRKVQEYKKMGAICMSWKAFSAMSEEEQMEYMKEMEMECKMSKNSLDLETVQKELELKFKADFEKKAEEMNKKFDDLNKTNLLLKFELDSISKEKERIDNQVFVDSLVKSHNPRLAPAKADYLLEKLSLLDNQELKVNYSVNNENKEVAVKQVVKDILLEVLPEMKSYSQDESLVNPEPVPTDSDVDGQVLDAKIRKYAKENNIELNVTTYGNIMDKIVSSK